MTGEEQLRALIDCVQYTGTVRPWREVPETDTSEDEPDGERLNAGVEATPHDVEQQPTDAQKHVGNYKKVHTSVQGIPVAIENPKGSIRTGVSKDGTSWSSMLQHHYGYIKRSEGADADQVDCFIGEYPDSQHVTVINQIDPETGRFDEHKVMLGFLTPQDAEAGYRANYESGWQGLGSSKHMSIDEFKQWLATNDTTVEAYSPDEPRDDQGRWTDSGEDYTQDPHGIGSPLQRSASMYSTDLYNGAVIAHMSAAIIQNADVDKVALKWNAEQDHIQAAKILVDMVRRAEPSDHTLYRSFKLEPRTPEAVRQAIENVKPGETLTLDRLSSFSTSQAQAAYYSVKDKTVQNIQLVIEGRCKALATDSMTGLKHQEYITQGRFKVVRIESASTVKLPEAYVGKARYTKTIVLQQEAVF